MTIGGNAESADHSLTYANMQMLTLNTEYSQSSLSSPEDLYREFHTNMSQFREPPPYPGPPKQSNSQTGLHQSFSGSETSTDVSVSSTENLPSCHRQEPQGEETQAPVTCVSYDSSEYSILERLGMPASAIEQKANTPQIYVSGNYHTDNFHGPYIATSVVSNPGFVSGGIEHQTQYKSSDSGFKSASVSSSKLTTANSSSGGSNQNISGYTCDQSTNMMCQQQILPNFPSPAVPSYNTGTIYRNYPQTANTGAMDVNQFSQYPHFMMPSQQFPGVQAGSNMLPQHQITCLPPPPEYPGFQNQELLEQNEAARRSYEILGKPEIAGSRSQPELSHIVQELNLGNKRLGIVHTPVGSGSDRGSQHSLDINYPSDPTRFTDVDRIAAQATCMVEVLTEENRSLRQKLSIFDRKVTKLQKFEMEIQKVYENYESLVKSSKKREQLELAMKKRLEEELKKIKAVNAGLVQQLQNAGITVSETQILASAEPVDSSMAHLLAKHKEILTIKERQERELEAQKTTIQEQRSQIDILRSVQVNQIREEEEALRQQSITEYDKEIQLELADIKTAYEKKGQTERNIRQKLEKEVEYCRQNHMQLGATSKATDAKRELNADIKKLLEEKESKILQLEKELIQWKEQHLEESMRKLRLPEIEIDTTPRLPPYEQATSSMNAEALINEAKTEKLRQMEEVYQANRKVAELEANVKSLQSQVKEKDAMLRVYQRSPITRSSSVHSIYCTPHHSPRPSLVGTGSLSRQSSQEVSSFLEVRHKKTGSTSALESYSRSSQEDLLKKIESLKSESKSGSDTEEDPDTVWQV